MNTHTDADCPRAGCRGSLKPSAQGDVLICRSCGVVCDLDVAAIAADAARYRALRSLALGDNMDDWTALYFLTDAAVVEAPGANVIFDRAVDALSPTVTT